MSTLIVLVLALTLFGAMLFRVRPLAGAVICGVATILALGLPFPLLMIPLVPCFALAAIFFRRQGKGGSDLTPGNGPT